MIFSESVLWPSFVPFFDQRLFFPRRTTSNTQAASVLPNTCPRPDPRAKILRNVESSAYKHIAQYYS